MEEARTHFLIQEVGHSFQNIPHSNVYRWGINITSVAIEGHELFTWTEVCEGVYRNVTYQCVFNFLEQFPDLCAVMGMGDSRWRDRAWVAGEYVEWQKNPERIEVNHFSIL